jgi:hypothetical protein
MHWLDWAHHGVDYLADSDVASRAKWRGVGE